MMEYDDEKEKMSTEEFILLMIGCGILCIFGYLIGTALMGIMGG